MLKSVVDRLVYDQKSVSDIRSVSNASQNNGPLGTEGTNQKVAYDDQKIATPNGSQVYIAEDEQNQRPPQLSDIEIQEIDPDKAKPPLKNGGDSANVTLMDQSANNADGLNGY